MRDKIKLGIIGHPLGHTLSPVMHKAAAAELGQELSYDPFDVAPEDLGTFMERLAESGLDGLNVTVPHKVAVMEWMDEVSGEAARIGAVNTIVIRDGRLSGHNTDAYGFISSVKEDAGVDPCGKRALVLGAGGAARAVVWSLASEGAETLIANRSLEKARRLAADFSGAGSIRAACALDSNKLVDYVSTADIIVNATSIGMIGAAQSSMRAVEDGLRPGQLVVDIVYRPLKTPLLLAAERAGAGGLDGLWMLIRQGAKSFELWTGGKFPVKLCRDLLLGELAGG